MTSSDSETDLPFPTPLPRPSFLTPNFSPAALLTTLTTRHQTLADLRAELATRSAQISSELEALVNAEYTSFLALGADLQGGGDKITEVRVGVLGYVKGLEALRDGVRERESEVKRLVGERRKVGREVRFARALLSVGERVGELEGALALGGEKEEVWSEEEEDEEDESEEDETEGTTALVGLGRLRRLVHGYVSTRNQIERLGGSTQPFLAKLEERMRKIRQTLLIDLGTALKQAKSLSTKGNGRVVKIMTLYDDMGEATAAIKTIKELARA
ncbi:hypothetical protein BT63DRAFT_461447 [Microthyrium microscopicum]|uniref:Conserved oligomeric Golgi complex subunit 2 n=1 Tax=Microthyrium microscopicum TaxID=703497 RepID=A0A6A6TWU6_9PEZI|nr:hypothetical protein BT63DRAFT_461447 [Microthyrium microscopicum]